MSERKGLVLDANILLRAVFGYRVRQILEKYEDVAGFYTPEACFLDAQKYMPLISKDRKFNVDLGLSVLDQICRVVERVERSLYEEYEKTAARPNRFARPGRLASRRNSFAAESTDLDRRSGLFWKRNRDVDNRSS